MRRALAMLLVIGFGLPLIAPAFASGPDEASLPACCRRNGAHHCSMAGMTTVNVPSHDRSVSAKCPYAPWAGPVLMLPHAFGAHTRSAAEAATAGPAAIIGEAESGYRISFHRARQKRGPPSPLAL